MLVKLGNSSCPFRPWRPKDGKVLQGSYALDTETTVVDAALIPDYVMGAASDGEQGYFLTRNLVIDFLQVHASETVVFHHALFDLKVLQKLANEQEKGIDVYELVDENRVYDIQLLHRLYTLSTDGHTSCGPGQSTLEHCCQVYLDLELPKDVCDYQGNEIRTSWDRFLGADLKDIRPIYLDYLGKDVLATMAVYRELMRRLDAVLRDSEHIWGYVSPEWLADQIKRWGPQTHHIQLMAAIVLDDMTMRGIGIDMAAKDELLAELVQTISEKAAALRRRGYVPGRGSAKVLQQVIETIKKDQPTLRIPITSSGTYRTDEESLTMLAGYDDFFQDLTTYKMAVKRRSTYLEKMTGDRIHPSYDVLKNTGRTSSFGAINIQNLPRDGTEDPQNDPGVRRCFVPSAGKVFFDCDYKTIELATLSQAVLLQLGLQSTMAETINQDEDVHTLVASQATGKLPDEVSKEERRAAKALNFGLPGGMGVKTLQSYAATTYKAQLNDEQAEEWRTRWLATFPEMQCFLDSGVTDVGLAAATFFELTPAEFNAAMGTPRYYQQPGDFEPAGWLGGMLLKAMSVNDPITNTGRFYSPIELEYFWTKVLARIDDLPPKLRKLVEKKEPSAELGKLMRSFFGRDSVFTLTGRLRAKATYCARHNTMFQGLAADGAKLALWKLWRSGYDLVAFVHDQVLIEVPANADLPSIENDIEEKMIEGMKAVVPDVRVSVKGNFKVRWTDAEKDRFVLPAGIVAVPAVTTEDQIAAAA